MLKHCKQFKGIKIELASLLGAGTDKSQNVAVSHNAIQTIKIAHFQNTKLRSLVSEPTTLLVPAMHVPAS